MQGEAGFLGFVPALALRVLIMSITEKLIDEFNSVMDKIISSDLTQLEKNALYLSLITTAMFNVRQCDNKLYEYVIDQIDYLYEVFNESEIQNLH